MNKHSEGPWKSDYPVLYSATGARLVTIDEYDCATIYDLPLMAAAPDMLLALELLVAIYDSNATGYLVGDAFTKARNLVKKVRGT